MSDAGCRMQDRTESHAILSYPILSYPAKIFNISFKETKNMI